MSGNSYSSSLTVTLTSHIYCQISVLPSTCRSWLTWYGLPSSICGTSKHLPQTGNYILRRIQNSRHFQGSYTFKLSNNSPFQKHIQLAPLWHLSSFLVFTNASYHNAKMWLNWARRFRPLYPSPDVYQRYAHVDVHGNVLHMHNLLPSSHDSPQCISNSFTIIFSYILAFYELYLTLASVWIKCLNIRSECSYKAAIFNTFPIASNYFTDKGKLTNRKKKILKLNSHH